MAVNFETIVKGLESVRSGLENVRNVGTSVDHTLDETFNDLRSRHLNSIAASVSKIVNQVTRAQEAQRSYVVNLNGLVRDQQRELNRLYNQWFRLVSAPKTPDNLEKRAELDRVIGQHEHTYDVLQRTYAAARKSKAGLDDLSKAAVESGKAVRRQAGEVHAAVRGLDNAYSTRLLRETWSLYGKINESLIEGLSSLKARNDMHAQVVGLATRYGVSVSHAAGIEKALVKYGQDLVGIRDRDLATILKMEIGLGASVDQTVQMKQTIETTGGSFLEVADAIASIVERTSLAADEASRFASELSNAALISGQGSRFLDKNLQMVSSLEGRMKSFGLQTGQITQLIERANTNQGMYISLGHGGGRYEMLDDPERMRSFFKTLVQRSTSFGPGAEGAITRQAYAEAYEIPQQLFAAMGTHAKEFLKEIDRSIDEYKQGALNRRYVQQLGETLDAVERLRQSVHNLTIYALEPVTEYVGRMSTYLSELLEWTSKLVSGEFLKRNDGTESQLSSFVYGALARAFKDVFSAAILYTFGRSVVAVGHGIVALSQHFSEMRRIGREAATALDRFTASMVKLEQTLNVTSRGSVGIGMGKNARNRANKSNVNSLEKPTGLGETVPTVIGGTAGDAAGKSVLWKNLRKFGMFALVQAALDHAGDVVQSSKMSDGLKKGLGIGLDLAMFANVLTAFTEKSLPGMLFTLIRKGLGRGLPAAGKIASTLVEKLPVSTTFQNIIGQFVARLGKLGRFSGISRAVVSAAKFAPVVAVVTGAIDMASNLYEGLTKSNQRYGGVATRWQQTLSMLNAIPKTFSFGLVNFYADTDAKAKAAGVEAKRAVDQLLSQKNADISKLISAIDEGYQSYALQLAKLHENTNKIVQAAVSAQAPNVDEVIEKVSAYSELINSALKHEYQRIYSRNQQQAAIGFGPEKPSPFSGRQPGGTFEDLGNGWRRFKPGSDLSQPEMAAYVQHMRNNTTFQRPGYKEPTAIQTVKTPEPPLPTIYLKKPEQAPGYSQVNLDTTVKKLSEVISGSIEHSFEKGIQSFRQTLDQNVQRGLELELFSSNMQGIPR